MSRVERTIRVWLDDVREAPAGWTRTYTAHETIALLEAGVVVEISLDHDLGDETTCGTGHDVVKWIEKAVALSGFKPPTIKIHSANVVGRRRMEQAIASIERRLRAALDDEARHKPLLARRIPRENIVVGRAYVIHARNGGVGVAVDEDDRLGYQLHRETFGEHYLFVEYDWADDPKFGTAIPLSLIEAQPPVDDDELLAWLANQTDEHRAEIDAAWEVVLGFPPRLMSQSGPRLVSQSSAIRSSARRSSARSSSGRRSR